MGSRTDVDEGDHLFCLVWYDATMEALLCLVLKEVPWRLLKRDAWTGACGKEGEELRRASLLSLGIWVRTCCLTSSWSSSRSQAPKTSVGLIRVPLLAMPL